MADVTKTVLTKFEADTTNMVASSKAMEKSLDGVAASADNVNKKQKEIGETSKKNEKQFKSSFGGMADGIAKLIPGFGAIEGGFKKAEGATKAFGFSAKSAIASTGIGLLVIAVGELVSKFGELSDKSADDLGVLETKLVSFGSKLKEAWDFVVEVTEATIKAMVGISIAEQAAHKARQAQREEVRKGWAEDVTAAEQRLAIIKAQKSSLEEIHAAELALNDAQWTAAKTAEERIKLSNQRIVSEVAYQTALKERADKEAEAAKNKKKSDSDEILAAQHQINLLQAQKANIDQVYAAERALIELRLGAGGTAAENLVLTRQLELLNAKYLADKEAIRLKDEAHAKDLQQAKEKEYSSNLLAEVDRRNKQQADQQQKSIDAYNKDTEEKKAASREAINGAIQQAAADSKELSAAIALVDTYKSINAVLADPTPMPTFLRIALAAFVGVMGLRNVKKIMNTKYEQGGKIPEGGGMIRGRRHYQGGVKFRYGGMAAEAEGGEYIVNRKATRRFLPQLEAINATGKKYADGGLLAAQAEFSRLTSLQATQGTQTVLVLEDFRRASNRLTVVETLAKS